MNFIINFVGYKNGQLVHVTYDRINKTLYVNNERVAHNIPTKQPTNGLFIRLILGTQCNLKCSYCSQFKSDIEYALKDCDSFKIPPNTEHIEFWGGEPLLYKKYIDRLLPRLKNIKKSLITNGILLNEDIVSWLNQNKIAVTISHDGPSNNRQNCQLDQSLIRKIDDVTISTVISADTRVFKTISYFKKMGIKCNIRFHPRIFNSGEYNFDDVQELQVASELFTAAQTKSIMGLRWDTINAMRGIFDHNYDCSIENPNVRIFDIKNNEFLCQNYVSKSNIVNYFDTNTPKKLNKNNICNSCILSNVCGGGCRMLYNRQFYNTCRSYFTYWIAMFSSAVYNLTGVVLDKAELLYVPYWNINNVIMRPIYNYQMPFLIESWLSQNDL